MLQSLPHPKWHLMVSLTDWAYPGHDDINEEGPETPGVMVGNPASETIAGMAPDDEPVYNT